MAQKREAFPGEETEFEREEWAPGKFLKLPLGMPTRIEDVGRQRLASMDAEGVDMQVLSLAFPGVESFDAVDATRVAAAVNDDLAEIVRGNPTRYAALATIAPQDPAGAAAELDRAVRQLGLKGAMINGSVHLKQREDTIGFIDKANLSQEDKGKILHLNARKLFSLG